VESITQVDVKSIAMQIFLWLMQRRQTAIKTLNLSNLSVISYHKLLNSVADPDHFDADPDPDPTSEKTRMWIRILDPDPIMLYIKFCNKIFLLKNSL
jgi:hypothetical protein